jgi:hypothetical protein
LPASGIFVGLLGNLIRCGEEGGYVDGEAVKEAGCRLVSGFEFVVGDVVANGQSMDAIELFKRRMNLSTTEAKMLVDEMQESHLG